MDKFARTWFPQSYFRITEASTMLRNSNWKLLQAIDPTISTIKLASPSFSLWAAYQRACVEVVRRNNDTATSVDKWLVELLSWMTSVVDSTGNFPRDRDWKNLNISLQNRIDKAKETEYHFGVFPGEKW